MGKPFPQGMDQFVSIRFVNHCPKRLISVIYGSNIVPRTQDVVVMKYLCWETTIMVITK